MCRCLYLFACCLWWVAGHLGMPAMQEGNSKKMENLLVSIPDAAKALGVGRSKLYQLIGESRLETVTIGRRRLVRTDSVRALALGEAE
jgi:excisionase family DNA binding protein